MNQNLSHKAVEDIALEWFIHSQEQMSESKYKEMQEWLQVKAHKDAFEEVQATWDTLDILQPKEHNKQISPSNDSTFSRRSFLYVSASLLVGGLAYSIYDFYLSTPVFKRTFASTKTDMLENHLPDGTKITLDIATKIEVAYYANSRETKLLYGQAMFEVAPNKGQPFSVSAGDTQVVVVGTRFSVRNIDGDVEVAVQKGHVKVSKLSNSQVVDLLAGDALNMSDATFSMKKFNVDPLHVGLWRYGRIAFENATLEEVIKEFERYGETRLIASPEVKHIHVTGSFDITYAGNFVEALPKIVPIRYQEQGDKLVIVLR